MNARRILRLSPLVALLLVAMLMTSSVAAAGASDPKPGPVPGQYIVLVADGEDPATIAAEYGVGVRHVYIAALQGFAGAVTSQFLAGLRTDPRVTLVTQDRFEFVLAEQSVPTGVRRI